jgi:hypothetical protein
MNRIEREGGTTRLLRPAYDRSTLTSTSMFHPTQLRSMRKTSPYNHVNGESVDRYCKRKMETFKCEVSQQ